MKFLKLVRTFKEGIKNFTRNGWMTFATISILTLALYVVSTTALLGITADFLIKNIRENITLSVYLNPEITEERAMQIKGELESKGDVKSIEYISSEKALEAFKISTEGDSVIIEALEEIGENPLPASLLVRANNSEQYDSIASVIENSNFREDISSTNYGKNREDIERINKVVSSSEKVGITLGGIFILISILITFNTIYLNMHSRRREYEIMRLVGASNTYVQFPSIFEGIFLGISAAIVAMILIPVTTTFISSLTSGIISSESFYSFYLNYFWMIFLAIVALGIILGVVSSLIAIRKYLKF